MMEYKMAFLIGGRPIFYRLQKYGRSRQGVVVLINNGASKGKITLGKGQIGQERQATQKQEEVTRKASRDGASRAFFFVFIPATYHQGEQRVMFRIYHRRNVSLKTINETLLQIY